ncbi:DUF883 family protein [Burkholderia gladioli]|uniref:DUF883 family protein n=1 Tax=Burkholderia gladioli TaxID=28095 RepID=UPI00163FCB23|nr:DUF883 family protein [Burkholderia gladioli]
MSEVNKEKLMSDIKTVLADAEDLLKQAAATTGDRASELREKAVRATDDYVHEHPWTSIGVAAGVGVLIGLLINRK